MVYPTELSWSLFGYCFLEFVWLLFLGVCLVIVSWSLFGYCFLEFVWLLFRGVCLVIVSWSLFGYCFCTKLLYADIVPIEHFFPVFQQQCYPLMQNCILLLS